MQDPNRPRALVIARVLLVVVPPLVLFGIAEAISWLAGVPRLADNKTFEQYEFMRDCRSRSDLIQTFCSPERFDEPDETTSVFVFGGSSVQGYPLGETVPFASYMQTMLDKRHPDDFAVHNLGVACRDSIFVRKCATRAGGDGSDFYVIYAGHNDFANFMVPNPKMRILSEEYPAPFRVQSLLAKSRFYSLIAGLVQGPPKAKFASWTRMPDPQWSTAREITLDQYANNIARVIELARERGVEVVLVTVVSNVSEYPAKRERWQKLIDRERPFPDQLQPWREHYARGAKHFEAAEYEESLAAFKQARDLAMGGRAPSELNEIVRGFAREHDHVHLVDFERTLDRVGVEEGHGCTFFGTEDWCDQFHPNPRLQKMIAREVVKKLLALRDSG